MRKSLSVKCLAAALTVAMLAAAAPALINILQIVALAQGQPLNTSLEAKINADATVIKTLAADFARASAASAPGICQQLEAGVNTYASDQQLVLQAAQVNDANTQTKITMLVDLVAGTVSAITAAIPSCQNAAAARSLNSAPHYNVSTFVDDYNRVLVTPTGNPTVDGVTSKLTLRRHSKMMRIITLGKLN